MFYLVWPHVAVTNVTPSKAIDPAINTQKHQRKKKILNIQYDIFVFKNVWDFSIKLSRYDFFIF